MRSVPGRHLVSRIAAVIACLLAIVALGCFLREAIGYSTGPTETTFDSLPRAGSLTTQGESLACTDLRLTSPHADHVYAIGRVRDERRLHELFPFLDDLDTFDGADSMNDRIPEALKRAAGVDDVFVPEDAIWIGQVDGHAGSVGVRAVYSASEETFYIDYSWDR